MRNKSKKKNSESRLNPLFFTAILGLSLHFQASAQQCVSFVFISSGSGNNFGIKEDSTLWAWGDNSHGQLGDGTQTNRFSPVHIAPGKTWRTVSAGDDHTVAIRSDGTLWAWGRNSTGQVDGTGGNILIPKQVGTASDWRMISAGYNFTAAIKNDGTLWAWGSNELAGLAQGTVEGGAMVPAFNPIPTQVGNSTWKVVDVKAHSLAVNSDGTLWAWGINYYGQLGDGTYNFRTRPTQIGIQNNWETVTVGEYFSAALNNDRKIYTWGYNNHGQLGNGTTTGRNTPMQLGTANWKQISAGREHILGIQMDGSFWGWGSNSYNLLGSAGFNNSDVKTPAREGEDVDWTFVSAGIVNSFALKSVGNELWATGAHNEGQLGGGSGVVAPPYAFLKVDVGRFTELAATNVSVNKPILQGQQTVFVNNCQLLANVISNSNNPVAGATTTKVWLESNQPSGFVKRHYEITPSNNASTASGRVTLYFTQTEFNDFNRGRPITSQLPSYSDDNYRKPNLLIEKRSGTSNDGTGLPTSYTGAAETINPNDADIVWNRDYSMWEVSFDVTSGFSGFFVKTQENALSVDFGNISASVKNGQLQVNWQTLAETNNKEFIVEASADGKFFKKIGTTPSLAKEGNSTIVINVSFGCSY